jgi:hypothetical protein
MKQINKFLFICYFLILLNCNINKSFINDQFDGMSDFFNMRDNINRQFKEMQSKMKEEADFLKNSTCLEGINCSVNSHPMKVSFNEDKDENEYILSLSLPNNVKHEDIHTNFIDGEIAQILVSNDGFHLKVKLNSSSYSVNAAAGSNIKNKEGTARASSAQQINQSSTLPNNIDIDQIRISFDQKSSELKIYMPILKKSKKSRQEIPVDLI